MTRKRVLRGDIPEGTTFGKLTVIGPKAVEFRSNQNRLVYPCSCECGQTKTILRDSLLGGRIVSCGCHKRAITIARSTTHGMSWKGPYAVWCGMKDRCSNPNHRSYARYGGRGIAVCREWLADFQVFHDWAMANGYSPELTLERIDNDGGYNPSNCKWITLREQTRNKSSNIYIEAFGERKILADWLNDPRCAVKIRSTIEKRIQSGWTAEQAISTKSSTCIGRRRNS